MQSVIALILFEEFYAKLRRTYRAIFLKNTMKKLVSQRIITITGLALIAVGLVLGYAPLKRVLGEREQQASASTIFEPPTTVITNQEIPEISGKPVHLTIQSIGYDGDVIDGNYNASNGSWTLSKDKAHFAIPSKPANNKEGNTFIYGHNNKYVFANMYKLKLGDRAQVITENGHIFTYEYYSLTVTNPEDTSLFNYAGPPILTIQTCSGSWYENRSLYAFKLVEVN